MMRSRSSGLLPITHSGSHHRLDQRSGLGFYVRRRTGSSAALQRLLTYVVLALLLGGSIYGVARVGRSGGGMGGTSMDELALSDALLEGARVSDSGPASSGRQQQQQQRRHHHHGHLHEDVHDRREALEQQHAAGAAGQHPLHSGGGELSQDQLEQHHIDQLQQLEQHHLAAQQHAAGQQQQGQGHELGAGAGHGGDLVIDPHVAAHIAAQQALPRREGPSLYTANLSAVDIKGNVVRTADLMGKVVVVVNVASQCGYTASNYEGLHRVYERYKHYGLEVIAFPCNQFGGQEPGTHAEIEEFVATRFHAQFPLMAKVEVNGPAAHPIFAWLKLNAPPRPGHRPGEDIAWNFEKFLLDKYGHPVKRYASDMDYHELELDVYNELIRF